MSCLLSSHGVYCLALISYLVLGNLLFFYQSNMLGFCVIKRRGGPIRKFKLNFTMHFSQNQRKQNYGNTEIFCFHIINDLSHAGKVNIYRICILRIPYISVYAYIYIYVIISEIC